MAYFEDLPDEYKDSIWEGMRQFPSLLDVDLDDNYTIEELDEAVDDYINCNNNETEVQEWVIKYCL